MSLELDRKSAVASGRVRPGAGRAMSTAWDHNSFVLDRLASHVLFPRDEARDDDDDAIYNENLTIDVNNGDVTSSYFVESSAADNDMMNTPKIEMSDDEDLSPKNDFSATWGDLGFGGVVGHSEVIGEFTLPVHQSVPSPPQFVYVESSVFPTNPMEVVDPMEVEGRDRPPATWAQRKTKAAGFKRLSISMDVPEQVVVAKDEQAPAVVVVDTPAVEMLLADADCSFDLLDFTMNDEFPVDDPEFLKQLEVDSLSPTLLSKDPLEEAMLQSELNGLGTINISDIKEDEEEEEEKTPADDVEWVPRVPSKGKKRMEKPGKLKAPTTKLRATTRAAPYAAPPRRRGRPPSSTVTSSACSSAAPSPRPSTSSDHSYMWRDSTSGLSEDEVKDFKYRRMRDLNNEASKRCRQNRKQKSDEMERSEKELVDRNAFLRAKVDSLERKKQILTDWIKKKGLLAKGSTGE